MHKEKTEEGSKRTAITYNDASNIVSVLAEAEGWNYRGPSLESPMEFTIQCEYDKSGRLTRRQYMRDGEDRSYETLTYPDDGTTVIEEKHMNEYEEIKTQTVYSDPDENGNYQTIRKYSDSGQGLVPDGSVKREYSAKIPRGVKYGTAGECAEEEKLIPLKYLQEYWAYMTVEEFYYSYLEDYFI